MLRAIGLQALSFTSMLVLALGAVADDRGTLLDWERASQAPTRGEVRALAVGGDGRLAFADSRGVWRLGPSGPPERAVLRTTVQALAFAGEALWIGAEGGLERLGADGRVVELAPGPGAAARNVRRIAADAGAVALATDDGVFVSGDGNRWSRVTGALPSGPVASVALRRNASGSELWIAVGGEVWRAPLRAGPGGLETAPPERVRAFAGRQRDFVDVLPGARPDVVLLAPEALVVRETPDSEWRDVWLSLPPGDRAERLFRAGDRWWIATDAGLLEAPRPDGPWRRAGPPAGTRRTFEVAAAGGRLYAATEQGLLRSRPAEVRAGGHAPVALELPPAAPAPAPGADPSPDAVRRAALAYLDVGPGRLRQLWSGVQRRGWLPELDLRFGASRDRDDARDFDQSFVSGDTRHLFDRSRDRHREWDASLTLTWDLGDLAYNAEAIDVSKEARELIELRDDILDEVTQLYFERQRVLLDLYLNAFPSLVERERLRLRAEELAAGLDAWTGGWFGRAVAGSP